MSQSKEKKDKKVSSGGATFWPMLEPRPKYPSFSTWLKKVIVVYTRAPLLLALATKAIFPTYHALMKSLESKGWSERKIFLVITCLVHSTLYVGINGTFFLLEKLGLMEEYRLAHKKSQDPSSGLIRRTLIEAFVGQVVVAPVAIYYGFETLKKLGMKAPRDKLPGLFEMYKQFAIAHFFNEFFFYWAHRLVHSKPLYALIHKQHHNWLGTKGIAAEFAHPVEQVLANFGPTLSGMLLFGRHPLVFWVWLAFRLEETYEAHGNYYFGNTWLAKIGLTHSEAAAFHSAHHSVNRGNFGMWTLDWLFGTMDSYLVDGDTEGYVEKRLGKGTL